MAAGDLLQKRSGSFGIAYESTPGTAEAAPVYYLTCDDANINVTPKTYERVNNIGAEVIGIQQSKYDVGFDASGIECGVEELGYLLWLALGTESNSPLGTHTISPQFEQNFLTAFVDSGGKFHTSFEVSRAVKAKIASLTIEQEMAAYGKVSLSGIATEETPLPTGFTPSLALGANDAPISWAAFVAMNIGWNGATPAVANYIKSFSLNIERELAPAAYKVDDELPAHISQGKRTVTFSCTFDLLDSDAQATGAWNAIKSAQDMEVNWTWVTGTKSITFTLKNLRVTNSPKGGVGAGQEPQEWTIEATAFQDDTYNTIQVISVDTNTTDYDAR